MKKKLQKQGGFTLVEMLIVVAIIAILICVSLPMISQNLDKAREATDDANMRAALGAAHAHYLANMDDLQKGTETELTWYYVIDADHQGTIDDTSTSAPDDGFEYGMYDTHKGTGITITVNVEKDEISGKWDEASNGGGGNP